MVSQITKTDLSERLTKLGLSRTYVWNLVNGKRLPSYALALRIQAECGIPLDHWAQSAAEPLPDILPSKDDRASAAGPVDNLASG